NDAERYEGDVKVVHCVASRDWPGLFHGSLTLGEASVLCDEPHLIGTFRLPPHVGPIARAYLLCGYRGATMRRDEGGHALDRGPAPTRGALLPRRGHR